MLKLHCYVNVCYELEAIFCVTIHLNCGLLSQIQI